MLFVFTKNYEHNILIFMYFILATKSKTIGIILEGLAVLTERLLDLVPTLVLIFFILQGTLFIVILNV